MKMKTKHIRLNDYPENIMDILAPFITGMGPTEVNFMGHMINLPKSKNFSNIIYEWQPVLFREIINISDREMRTVMGDETRATIINDKGEEYYAEWINRPVFQR